MYVTNGFRKFKTAIQEHYSYQTFKLYPVSRLDSIYNSSMLQPIESQGLSTCCWPHSHLSAPVNGHSASLRVTCGQHVESLNQCQFSNRYKSVAIQISHVLGLTLIPNISKKNSSATMNQTVSASEHFALNRVPMGPGSDTMCLYSDGTLCCACSHNVDGQ